MFIIGDVHGELQLLQNLLSYIEDDHVYFVGDLIDRGPKSIETLQFVIENTQYKVVLGNHEEMMLNYLRSIGRSEKLFWFDNYGNTTLKSYSCLSEKKQQQIFQYLQNLPYYYYIEDLNVLISHAGVKGYPLTPVSNDFNTLLNMQKPNDFLWSRRREFIFNDYIKSFNTIFISGHTPTTSLGPSKKDPKIVKIENRFLIDCGAFFTGILAGIQIADNKVTAHYYSNYKGYFKEELGDLR